MRARSSFPVLCLTGLCLFPVRSSLADGLFHHAKAPAKLQGRARVLHALNRFTFGPTPAEIASADKVGLNRWFEQQLNPARLDDSTCNRRLGAYPALQLPPAELLAQFPAPDLIRQMADGKRSLPDDPRRLAIVEDEIASYQLKKQMQAEKKADSSDPKPVSLSTDQQREGKVQLATLTQVSPHLRLQAILAIPPSDFAQLRQNLHGADVQSLEAGMPAADRETFESLNGGEHLVTVEEEQSRLERDLYSNRQLEAVMTDFWLNHFNVYAHKNQEEPYYLTAFERDTIRPRALGSFEDLLVATAESPAMLDYLDNASSMGPDSQAAGRPARNAKQAKGLNENYGRELMELHTLGVGGGYTQADVTEVAKVFTGWTIDKETGAFKFDPKKHQPGSKVVLGKTIPEGGMQEGLTVLHMLATSPATARFLAQKLAVRFVSDEPPKSLVDHMAESFLKSHGDTKALLRTLWKSHEFWTLDVYRAKMKTPEEFVISAVRASGADVSDPAALVQAIARLGMPLYGMATPNGYGWKQDGWVNSGALVNRMNFALMLAGDHVAGVHPAWPEPGSPVVPVAYTQQATNVKERRLEMLLLGEPVSDRTRQAVLAQSAGDAKASVMAGLLLGSPEFQRR